MMEIMEEMELIELEASNPECTGKSQGRFIFEHYFIQGDL